MLAYIFRILLWKKDAKSSQFFWELGIDAGVEFLVESSVAKRKSSLVGFVAVLRRIAM